MLPASRYDSLRVRADVAGNSFATLEGPCPRVLLAGHIDEIGLMVTYIDDEGYLFFAGIGGWDSHVLVGQRVRLLGHNGEVVGVIGKKPIHLLKHDERDQVTKLDRMWIDIGVNNRAEALEHVRIGCTAVVDAPFYELPNDRIVSRATATLDAWKKVEYAQVPIDHGDRANVWTKAGDDLISVRRVKRSGDTAVLTGIAFYDRDAGGRLISTVTADHGRQEGKGWRIWPARKFDVASGQVSNLGSIVVADGVRPDQFTLASVKQSSAAITVAAEASTAGPAERIAARMASWRSVVLCSSSRYRATTRSA